MPFLILVFATVFITLCKFYAKKLKFSYRDVKYRHLFLQTRKFYNRHQMLLIFPNDLPSILFFNDLQTTGTKVLFSYEYFSFANNSDVMGTNMSLYALSKLKLIKISQIIFPVHITFIRRYKYHPGQIQYPCVKCTSVVQQRTICCGKC